MAGIGEEVREFIVGPEPARVFPGVPEPDVPGRESPSEPAPKEEPDRVPEREKEPV